MRDQQFDQALSSLQSESESGPRHTRCLLHFESVHCLRNTTRDWGIDTGSDQLSFVFLIRGLTCEAEAYLKVLQRSRHGVLPHYLSWRHWRLKRMDKVVVLLPYSIWQAATGQCVELSVPAPASTLKSQLLIYPSTPSYHAMPTHCVCVATGNWQLAPWILSQSPNAFS